MTRGNWIVDSRTGHQHLDGTPWHRAPQPWRWHRCRPHTTGTLNGKRIQRCACGGLRADNGPWIARNERRHKHRLSTKD